jgi:hypothetical protein
MGWMEYLRLVDRHRTPALSWAALRRVPGLVIPEPAKQELQKRSDACRIVSTGPIHPCVPFFGFGATCCVASQRADNATRHAIKRHARRVLLLAERGYTMLAESAEDPSTRYSGLACRVLDLFALRLAHFMRMVGKQIPGALGHKRKARALCSGFLIRYEKKSESTNGPACDAASLPCRVGQIRAATSRWAQEQCLRRARTFRLFQKRSNCVSGPDAG